MNWAERVPPSMVLKYYAYQATTTLGFYSPVFTLFLLERNLSYAQIGLLGSVSAGVTVVGELPTGYVADRLGRRNSLVLGSVCLAASVFGFVFARTFPGFVVLWVLFGLGLSFRSGSADAWLYDSLRARLDESMFTRVRGRGTAVNQFASAAAMLTSGAMYGVDHELPFLVTGVVLSASVPVALSFPRTQHRTDTDTDTDTGTDVGALDAIPTVRRQLSRPPLRSFVLYVGLFFGVIWTANDFIQPIATHSLGVSPATLGPIYAGFTVVSALGGYFAGTIERRLTVRSAILLVPLSTALLLIVPAFVPLVAFPMFFAVKSARAVTAPIVQGYVNRHVDEVGRATVLSGASLIYALIRLPLQPLAGTVADLTAPIPAVAALGVGFVAAAAAINVWEPPADDGGGRNRASPNAPGRADG